MTMTEKIEKAWSVATKEEVKAYRDEVERLKEKWISIIREPTTREALANLREDYERINGFAAIIKESEERAALNDRFRKEYLHKIKLENKNLEWPKPDRPFVVRKSEDYWKPDGCVWCGYRPKTTHDYEVHIVTGHPPGTPAYPGSPDLEKYRQLQDDKKRQGRRYRRG